MKGANTIQAYADQPEAAEAYAPEAGVAFEEEKEVAGEDVDNVEALPDSISQVKPTQS